MRLVIAGLLLALGALTSRAATVKKTTELCSSDSNYWEDCPIKITNVTFNATADTTGDVSFFIGDPQPFRAYDGTAYICLETTAGAKTAEEVLNGTGCEATKSVAYTSGGLKTTSFTGLTVSTTYYPHVIYRFQGTSLVATGTSDTTSAPFNSGGDIVASCGNIGTSDGTGYSITGTTYQVTTSDTLADVKNNITPNLVAGDAVLFQAGGTWTLSTEADRIIPVSGVTYGRYGAGANPKIDASSTTDWSANFRGIFHIDGQDNVVIDGIDLTGSTRAAILARATDGTTISRLTVSNNPGGGIVWVLATNGVQEKTVTLNADSPPHEANTIDQSSFMVYRYNRTGGNGHASLNVKGGSHDVQVYENEIYSSDTDPNFYCERCYNIDAHDNWIHTSGADDDNLMMLGVENLGSSSTQFDRNIDIYNNIFENATRSGLRLWIQGTVSNPTAGADQMMHDIHIFNNTFYNTGQQGNTYYTALKADDGRSPPDPDDWSAIVIEDNIFWQTGTVDAIDVNNDGIDQDITTRYNLFETGETGFLGSNAITTSTEPFVDRANGDWTPSGAAVGAGVNGGDDGATITWTCGQ